jgi:sugar transferase (PEP-CTERM/EpsH1 system associated)
MNILSLTPQLPYPMRQGTTIRNFGIISFLARRHTVDLLTFLAPGQQLEPENALYHLCRRVAAVPQPARAKAARLGSALFSLLPDMALRLEDSTMHQLVEEWVAGAGYDLVQVEGIEMAQYGRHADGLAPVVFDDHNCEYLLQQRNAYNDLRTPRRWHAAAYSLVQWQKLRGYEARVCRAASAVVAVSEPDRRALAKLVPEARVSVVPNGIDLSAHTPASGAIPASTPVTLLFTGKMDYRPNVDAALWFGRSVLPLVLAKRAGVRVQYVGLNPHARLAALRHLPQVEITGAVPDVRPYMASATIYIIPMRVGGGTRFKALEAMAAAKPIVSTTMGVEGLPVRDGRELLLADSPESFAEAILRLLDDIEHCGGLAHTLGAAARQLVASQYTWDRILPSFEQLYTTLVPASPIRQRVEGVQH